eukprot:scaffold2059_cov342-Prasinococcus_capsulatus_cf.AAC.2
MPMLAGLGPLPVSTSAAVAAALDQLDLELKCATRFFSKRGLVSQARRAVAAAALRAADAPAHAAAPGGGGIDTGPA